MASISVRAGSLYGFNEDIRANLDSDFEQGDIIPIGLSDLENDSNGSVGATDHLEEYSPHLDLALALKLTPPEHAWGFQSPSANQDSIYEPQEDESSSPEVEILKDGEASADEEESLTLTFQSKYVNIFPLYQDYTLKAIGDEIQKLRDELSSEQGKSNSIYSLCSSLKARNHLEVPSPYVTGESTPSQVFFPGRRSAVRRHSHTGVVSPHRSPESLSKESSSHERVTLSTCRPLQEKLQPCYEVSSPTRPPSFRFTSCTMWQDLEEVKASGLLNKLTPKDIGVQETMFELIGSEVSYLKSLGVLVNHFYASKKLKKTLSETDHYTVFCNIHHVMEANTKFLLDLEARLGESLIIFEVGDIVLQHCGSFQQHYVPYVTNMMFQEALVNQLLQQNKGFVYALKKLERDPVCQKQTLKSFLVLPFQRITRIKLLLESILKVTEPDADVAATLKAAIKGIHEIVLKCDQNVERMKRLEELLRLEVLMDFADVKSVPLVKSTRFLIHHGPLATVETCGSKLYTTRIYLHLFNDLLMVSAKKNQRFTVLDYALFPEHVTVLKNKVLGLPLDSFLLNLSQSQTGSPTTMILIANDSFDKKVWIKALSKM